MAGKVAPWSIAMENITMSAANTMTSSRFDFNLSIQNQFAIEILQLEYYLNSSAGEFAAASDYLHMSISTQETPSTYLPTNSQILRYASVRGIGAATEPLVMPIKDRLEDANGHGLLVVPDSVWAVLQTSGFAAAAQVIFLMKYRVVKVTREVANAMLLQVTRIV